MPVYEFHCPRCNTGASILVRNIAEPFNIRCPSCGNRNLKRAVSRFAYHKSMATIHNDAGEPVGHPAPDYYRDPRNIGRWAEKRVQELGLEMPPQVEEMIRASREGKMPQPIKDL